MGKAQRIEFGLAQLEPLMVYIWFMKCCNNNNNNIYLFIQRKLNYTVFKCALQLKITRMNNYLIYKLQHYIRKGELLSLP